MGFDFLFVFEEVLSKISANPYYASYVLKQARGGSLKRFPYQVIYEADEHDSKIIVLAIAHHHRNPEWFKQRLRELIVVALALNITMEEDSASTKKKP